MTHEQTISCGKEAAIKTPWNTLDGYYLLVPLHKSHMHIQSCLLVILCGNEDSKTCNLVRIEITWLVLFFKVPAICMHPNVVA